MKNKNFELLVQEYSNYLSNLDEDSLDNLIKYEALILHEVFLLSENKIRSHPTDKKRK